MADRSNQARLRVIFAGGGTGGHIFPALAIAEALQADRAICEFLVSSRPLDEAIMQQSRQANSDLIWHALPAKPLAFRPGGLWRFLKSWGPSVRASRRVLQQAKADGAAVVLVAMGGFVAAPAAQAARAERVPVLLVNLDAVPGKANRWIAAGARSVLSGAALAPHVAARAASWRVIPPIVRRGAALGADKASARSALGLDADKPTLLVTGGSQGAGTINELMCGLTQGALASSLTGWQVLHQVGPSKEGGPAPQERLRAAYARAGVRAVVEPFVEQMGWWWGASDVAVCRAGAGNVAEAWANGVPAIFLPYPFHRDQHQKFNAQVLVQAGGAIVLDDLIDAQRNLRSVAPVIAEILSDATRREELTRGMASLGPANGAAEVRAAIMALAQG